MNMRKHKKSTDLSRDLYVNVECHYIYVNGKTKAERIYMYSQWLGCSLVTSKAADSSSRTFHM
jgi:hypothetical protein